MIDWNCPGDKTFESLKNSSSVRTVEIERLTWAPSTMLGNFLLAVFWLFGRTKIKMNEEDF
jgi:hypothetical protein